MTQEELWQKVNDIKQNVITASGGDLSSLSYSFRSSDEFLGYIAMCGETQVDYNEGELSEKVVRLLDDYAQKVLDLLAKGQR